MTDLYDRLFPQFPEDGGKVAVRPLCAMLSEYVDGRVSRQSIVEYPKLKGQEVADLDAILSRLDAIRTRTEKERWIATFEGVCVLAETGVRYTDKQSFALRLGLV
jgi:hypothetical protein